MAENIKSGKYYRVFNGTDWDRMHFVTDAKSVLTDDGKTVETTLATINESLGGLRFGTDGEGNYGYFGADGSLIPFKRGDSEPEIEIVPLVPTLTSNTGSDGGEVIFSGQHANYNGQEYKAFDGDYSTHFMDADNTNGSTIGYKFASPTCVKSFSIMFTDNRVAKSFNIEASNDNRNWVTLASISNDRQYVTGDLNNNEYYLYYRFKKVTGSSMYNTAYIDELQFYGYQMKALVPAMTSDTTPNGEAFASETFNAYTLPYKAFDGNTDTSVSYNYWASTNSSTTEKYLGYDFGKPVKVACIEVLGDSGTNASHFEFDLEYSDDKNSWNSVGITGTVNANTNYYMCSENKAHRYWRIIKTKFLSAYYTTDVVKLQFYAEPEGTAGGETVVADMVIPNWQVSQYMGGENTYLNLDTKEYDTLQIESATNSNGYSQLYINDVEYDLPASNITVDVSELDTVVLRVYTQDRADGTTLTNIRLTGGSSIGDTDYTRTPYIDVRGLTSNTSNEYFDFSVLSAEDHPNSTPDEFYKAVNGATGLEYGWEGGSPVTLTITLKKHVPSVLLLEITGKEYSPYSVGVPKIESYSNVEMHVENHNAKHYVFRPTCDVGESFTLTLNSGYRMSSFIDFHLRAF